LFVGDGRVNEFSGITTMHVVWVREHNSIEEIFHHLNPHWDGERLYQETRRLITALWQYSTYHEYLPLILGRKAMDAHGLTLVNSGYWNGKYNMTIIIKNIIILLILLIFLTLLLYNHY